MNFQDQLQEIKFKTLHTQSLVYADIFHNRRIIIFSTPAVTNTHSWKQVMSFNDNYQKILGLGIDDIYAVSSFTGLIIPYIEIFSKDIVPLWDDTKQFVSALTEYVGRDKNLNEQARMWQYVAIINNGSIEKFFNNPVQKNMSLQVYNDIRYHYRGLGVNTIIEYLQNS